MQSRLTFLVVSFLLVTFSSFAQTVIPIDFENEPATYDFLGFEGAQSSIIANPDMNGNPSASVMQTIKGVGAQFFAGTFINLDVPIDFTNTNNLSVDVWSPKAGIPVRMRLENGDNSISAELDQTIGGANAWETLTFDFTGQVDPSAEYVRVIVFFEFVVNLSGDGTTYYFDNIDLAAPPAPTIGLPLGFELDPAAYDFLGFEGAQSTIIANPDMNGNTSASVMETIKGEGAQFFAGTFINLDTPIDFSASSTLSVDVWSPKADIPVRMRLENADNSVAAELDQTIVGASAWETLNFDFTGQLDPNAEYVRVVLFFEFVPNLPGDGTTYYFDNIDVSLPTAPTVGLPLDFELDPTAYDFLGFEGAQSTIIANPDMNGNASASVMETIKGEGAQFFAGTFINLDVPVDFSASSTLSVDVWSPKADIPVRMRLENADNSVAAELDQTVVGASAWETLNFDFTGLLDANAEYVRVVLFFEFVPNLPGDGSTYYFDNIDVLLPPSATIALPLDFELDPADYDFIGFEGAQSTIIANPDMNGNTSASVMETVKSDGAQFFAGTAINLNVPIDFSMSSTISVDVWSPKAGIPVRLRLENADNSVAEELDQTVVGASAWETLNFDFTGQIDPNAEYTKVVLFFEFVVNLPGDGSTYYFDNIAVALPPAPTVALPLDFELDASAYDFLGFEGAQSTIIPNPDMTGNTSATVMESIKTEGAQFFAGTFINLDESIDFSTTNTLSVDVWSPKGDIPVRMRLENADNSVGAELDQNIVGASAWETLNFDFTGLLDPNVEYVRVVLFFEFVVNLPGDGTTYYFDNVDLSMTSSTNNFVISNLDVFPNPAQNIWNIQSGDYQIEDYILYDYTGKAIFSQKINDHNVIIPAANLPSGMYIVDLKTAQGSQLIKLIKQ